MPGALQISRSEARNPGRSTGNEVRNGDLAIRSGHPRSTLRFVALQPLPTRSELPPDDAAVVIRAGVLGQATIEQSAQRCLAGYGLLGISDEGALGTSVADACRTSPRQARHRQVRLSTFGRLRAAGFVLIATFESPHFTLALTDLSELTLARLVKCFDDPIPNPGYRPQG